MEMTPTTEMLFGVDEQLIGQLVDRAWGVSSS
jgi:hypothetical protein